MKTIIWLLFLMGLACSCARADNVDRRLRLVYRDYAAFDQAVRPITVGATLWESKELPHHAGLCASIAVLTYDKCRLEVGAAATLNGKQGWANIAMLTGVAYQLNTNWSIGIWMAPFWNLYGARADDPWGISLGYTFGKGF